jgi:hypothetical protein
MEAMVDIDEAEHLFLQSLEGEGSPTSDSLFAALRRFAAIEFDVSDNPDSDGFLFEYGTFVSLPRPGFTIGFVRQFGESEGVDEDESYTQLSIEYRYDPDDELDAVGRRKEWWFKSDSDVSFDDWLDSISRDVVWSTLSGKRALGFSTLQERI